MAPSASAPTLRMSRIVERWVRWENQLAAAIAADVGAGSNDPEPRVVAAALIGAVRVAAEAAPAEMDPKRRRAIADRAFGILGLLLAQYGTATGA
jgi:hypothetical protein